jgi:nuclear transport factor 2 (NTF2) superfamily protein
MTTSSEVRPPLPPFDRDSAATKVRVAEDAWNSCDPGRVSLAIASMNDLPIEPTGRKLDWPAGRRPDDFPTLSELGM